MASRRAGCVPLDQQVELLREENNRLKRENQKLSRTHKANTELQHENDRLKRENKKLRINSTYYLSSLQVAHGVWVFALDVLHALNRAHSNFQSVFFDNFRALLGENDDAVFVRRMGNYIRLVQSMYMFVRVERPVGSLRFVLAYVKCDWVFSLVPRFEQMRLRLNRVPPRVLRDVESGENKALRLACVGETDYERALTTYRNDNGKPPLNAALKAEDEDAAEALLDGGDDPNEVDEYGWNALHRAAWKGCRLPLFHRILGMIHNVNAVDNDGTTALMFAAGNNHLDMVVSLMNHPGIDVNLQDLLNYTALQWAVSNNRPAMVAQLVSDDRVDTSLKEKHNYTPLKLAIRFGKDECAKILRKHGAPEE